MSTAQLAPGTAIEGYTIHAVARTRAGASTHDAVDPAGAPVQVTIYAPECFPSALVLERSLRELRQLQTLQHPRIVKVHGCGKLPNGSTWEAHDPLPSTSLAEHLRGGPLPEPDALAIAQQIGEALADAQKVGVIHRNLGADVIFPSPTGVIVAGFAVGAPQGGRSFGALDSIAPEQVEGKVVDQRTLIYNLAALVHFMISGKPLFAGEPAEVLQAHVSTDVADSVVAPLRRGLAKDPRMRPMMLKQFVTELGGGLVGAVARGTAAPTSRGWTLFTSAIESPAEAAAAVTPEPDAPKPSTRGWTMFTQEAGSDPAPASPAAAAEPDAPIAPTPGQTVAAPAASPTAPKPSTRGWTMFMQAQDDSAATSGATPAAAPVSAAASTPAAAPASAPVGEAPKPSTRGWTMFTATDPEPASSDTAPAASAAVVPAPSGTSGSGPVVAAPPAAGAAPKPSSRGWTMFTKDDDGATAGAAASPSPSPSTIETPVAPPPATAAASSEPAPAAGGEAGEGAPPSSRGWTMFMEPATGAAAAAATPAAPPTAPASEPTPVAGATPMMEADALPGGTRRGWTMFMEAPIDDAGRRPFGPSTPASAAPTPPPPAAEEPSSDGRGWTVFGAPAPGAAPEPGATPAAGSSATVVSSGLPPLPPPPQDHGTDAVSLSSHDASEAPTASGSVTAVPTPEPAPGRTKTVVATGVEAIPGGVGGVTGRTVFPAPGQPGAEMPDTMYFRRGDIPPERPTSRTTAVDVIAPVGRPPAEERGSAPMVMPGRDAPVALANPRRTGPLVAVGVVVVGLIVLAVIWLT